MYIKINGIYLHEQSQTSVAFLLYTRLTAQPGIQYLLGTKYNFLKTIIFSHFCQPARYGNAICQ